MRLSRKTAHERCDVRRPQKKMEFAAARYHRRVGYPMLATGSVSKSARHTGSYSRTGAEAQRDRLAVAGARVSCMLVHHAGVSTLQSSTGDVLRRPIENVAHLASPRPPG